MDNSLPADGYILHQTNSETKHTSEFKSNLLPAADTQLFLELHFLSLPSDWMGFGRNYIIVVLHSYYDYCILQIQQMGINFKHPLLVMG